MISSGFWNVMVFWSFTKGHFFPLPFVSHGQGEETGHYQRFTVASSEGSFKGHATKRSDWRGLCNPEPMRSNGHGIDAREAVKQVTFLWLRPKAAL
jgi:hypothetical protein